MLVILGFIFEGLHTLGRFYRSDFTSKGLSVTVHVISRQSLTSPKSVEFHMGPCVREYVVQAAVDWRPVEKL